MRLIDANKLGLHFNDWRFAVAPIDKTGHEPKEYTSHDIKLATYITIGEAMRGIDEAPTVDAIPVEWIENYAKENYPIWDRHAPIRAFYTNMIKVWRKENESNNNT